MSIQERASAERTRYLAEQNEPVAWEFQHRETGRMAVCSNDGVNNPENFKTNNPWHDYVGPLYRHPTQPDASPVAQPSEALAGWVMVPLVPTDAMIDAANDVLVANGDSPGWTAVTMALASAIEAAPPQGEQEKKGG